MAFLDNKIQLKSYSFSHTGKRISNEDYFIADDVLGIYIITDGMGGYNGGKVASKLVANSCYDFLKAHKHEHDITENLIDFVQNKLNEKAVKNPEFSCMGTTLCCLFIHDEYMHIIHLGDSKILVAGDIDFETQDHTFAQLLVNLNYISLQDYRKHPKRHILTRCLSANNAEKHKAEYKKLQNKSCKIFLCSDGVMECFTETELIKIMHGESDFKKAIQMVEQKSIINSNDNCTAILVEYL